MTYGAVMAEMGQVELEPHTHKKGQIILVQRGALSCEVDGGLWMVPPRSAIWIPGGAMHAIKGSGLEGYNAFIAHDVAGDLPKICCALSVGPLLRALLIRSASLPLLYEQTGPASRMVTVLLDEIAAAPVENLHLPMPVDKRLRNLVERMMALPAERGTMESWASHVGVSERTFARLIGRETGMSFGRWRQQLGVMLAVKWMAGGATIQQVAADLGYESMPSFVTMFRKALGTSPGRYMAERHPGNRR
ncbi:helix-turn-helix domain-containing protein [Sphingomonas sp. ERG5]|uniref:helix-turn-helix domain-containing protein n=1 Tax=Sphingomonas sp. ERG5 TaxID=1381597 RepID=UPI000ABBABBA|nr:helix-turn-helix transcriptional regulator [Sphingomonas sp. ERG5]